MTSGRSVKVILDTNIWISFLIGEKLQWITSFISDRKITLILAPRLLLEIEEVTGRPEIKKYFPETKVKELFSFLEAVGESFEIEEKVKLCRDPKDNFLLDLIETSNADFLVTGDKDLLEIKKFKSAKILTAREFEEEVNRIDFTRS